MGIDIRAVGRQVADADPASRKQLADDLDFVGVEVVEDDDVAGVHLGTELLLMICCEHLGFDLAFDQEGSFDAFITQGRNESGTLPVAMRDGVDTTLAQRTAAIVAGQLGIQAGFHQ